MSTKEMAYSIIDQLGEEELQGFITLFRRLYPQKRIWKTVSRSMMKWQNVGQHLSA